jgi:hypothetical protein
MIRVVVNKITWQQVGLVTEPGRYMFRFGWLTVTPEDIAVWNQFPDAIFTLVKTPSSMAEEETEEYHLGVFELQESSPPAVP